MMIVIPLALTLMLSTTVASEVEVERSIGHAFNNQGQVVYIEKHSITKKNSSVESLETNYFDTEGNQLGKLSSDFSTHPYIPTYEFNDYRFGKTAGIKRENSKVVAFTRPSKKARLEVMTVDLAGDLVTGQGLHNFLYSNMEKLISSKDTVKISFLVPQNQDTYQFQIKTIKKKENQVTFRIEPESWLFRLLAPHIDVTYDLKNKNLLLYEGPSNLLNPQGEKQHVVIKYKETAL